MISASELVCQRSFCLRACSHKTSAYPQLKGPQKFVDCDSICQTQGVTQFVDCLVWIWGEAKQRGIRKWSWVGNGPKEMPSALTLPLGLRSRAGFHHFATFWHDEKSIVPPFLQPTQSKCTRCARVLSCLTPLGRCLAIHLAPFSPDIFLKVLSPRLGPTDRKVPGCPLCTIQIFRLSLDSLPAICKDIGILKTR